MNAAVALLVDAAVAGVTVRLVDGRAKVFGQPAPSLLELLRGHKAEIVAILRGDACRRCGRPIGWGGLAARAQDTHSPTQEGADPPTQEGADPPTQEGADAGPAWNDLDAWCRCLGPLPTVAERRLVLREWVAAAGGWNDAVAIHLPVTLPKGLALARLKAHARALGMQILEDEDELGLQRSGL